MSDNMLFWSANQTPALHIKGAS